MSRKLLGLNPETELYESFEAEGLVQIAQVWNPAAGFHSVGVAGTNYVVVPATGALAENVNLSGLGRFRFDPARYDDGGGDLWLQLLVDTNIDNTAMGATAVLTYGMYPVTTPNVDGVAADLGTLVTGSATNTLTNKAAQAETLLTSGLFAAPAAGRYAIGIAQTGAALAAGCFVTHKPELLVVRG